MASSHRIWHAFVPSSAFIGALVVALMAGSMPIDAAEIRFAPLDGKTIGAIVVDTERELAAEGRSGPRGSVLFARDDASLRWLLLPARPGEHGETATVETGPTFQPRAFPNVLLATENGLRARGLSPGYRLVEIEVNGGAGSPPVDRFVATGLKRLDGSPEMPFDLDRSIRSVLERCRSDVPRADLEDRFARTRDAELGKGASVVKEERETHRATWLSTISRAQLTCAVVLTGHEGKTGHGVEADPAIKGGGDGKKIAYGKQFSVQWTARYLISPYGEFDREPAARFETFSHEIPPPGHNEPPYPPSR